MSDFISDLERELTAAARRRAAGRRRRRFVPRPATVLAVAVVAALLVTAVTVVRGLDTSRPGDEQPAPPPGTGVALALPAADVARDCPTHIVRSPASGPESLAVFSREQTEPDGLPTLDGSYSWVPASVIYPDRARRPMPGAFDKELHLLPVNGLQACRGPAGEESGVCLVVGSGEMTVRCFSLADVEAGRALALTSPELVHGVAPDGAGGVTLSWSGGSTTVPVVENAFEAAVPLRAGDTVRVQLEKAAAECRPSDALLEAVPALREDAGWTSSAPLDLDPSVGQLARPVAGGDGLELWVAVACTETQQGCVVALFEGRPIAQPCGSAGEIRNRGVFWMFPVAGGLAVAGLAPEGTRRVEAVFDSRLVHELPLTDGVFGGMLPPGFGDSVDPGEQPHRIAVRFRRTHPPRTTGG